MTGAGAALTDRYAIDVAVGQSRCGAITHCSPTYTFCAMVTVWLAPSGGPVQAIQGNRTG